MLPIISAGEHLTIATQGIEKRNISKVEYSETDNGWGYLTITENNGSYMQWLDHPHVIERTTKRVKRLLKEPVTYNDDSVVIDGQPIEIRLIHAYDCELDRPSYPKLQIHLHGGDKIIVDTDWETVRNEYIKFLIAIHKCSKREARLCADCRH